MTSQPGYFTVTQFLHTQNNEIELDHLQNSFKFCFYDFIITNRVGVQNIAEQPRTDYRILKEKVTRRTSRRATKTAATIYNVIY